MEDFLLTDNAASVAMALKDLPPSGSYLYAIGKSLGGFYWQKGEIGFTFGFNQKYIRIAPEEYKDFVRFIKLASEYLVEGGKNET